MSQEGRPKRKRVWTRLSGPELEFVRELGDTAGLNHDSEKLRYCINLLKTITDGEMFFMPKEAAEVIRSGEGGS